MMASKQTSRVRWFLVLWLFILSAVAYLDRVNLSVAKISIGPEYGLSDIQFGWVFGAFSVGYALFQTVGGRLADRFGPRRVLPAGVLWWGIFTALTVAIPAGTKLALFFLIAVRFLLGAGEAVVYPASNRFVARWIPIKERGIANGWIFAGVGAGAGLGQLLVVCIMRLNGWRSSFWICAVIGLIVGAVWYSTARDGPEDHPGVSASELDTIRRGIGLERGISNEKGQSLHQALVSWRTVFSSRTVLALTFSYFCYGYVAWMFFNWFFTYLAQVRGLNLKASPFYAMLPFLAMAVGCAIGGLLNDWLTRQRGLRVGRCGLAGAAMVLTGAFLAFGSTVHSARLASVVLAGGAGVLYLSQSSFWSLTADIAGASSGSVSGFMNMGNQTGGIVTSLLTPVIARHFGWTASFLVAAGLCILGSLAWWLVDPQACLTGAPKESPGAHPTAALRVIEDNGRAENQI